MPLSRADARHSASFLRSHTVTHSTGGVKGMVVVSLRKRQTHECSRACVGPDCCRAARWASWGCHRMTRNRAPRKMSTSNFYLISLSCSRLALASGRAHVNQYSSRCPVAIGDCVLGPSGVAHRCIGTVLAVALKHTLSSRTTLAHAPLTHMNSRTKKTLFPPQPAPPAIQIQHPKITQ